MEKSFRFKYGRARAKLSQMDEGLFALFDLWSGERGKGHATQLMQIIVKFADLEQLTLRLIVMPYGHPINTALDRNQLEKFYSRFGFVRDDNQDRYRWVTMVRHPSREIHTT